VSPRALPPPPPRCYNGGEVHHTREHRLIRPPSVLLSALMVAVWLLPAPADAKAGKPAEEPAAAPTLEAHRLTPDERLERGRQAFDNGEYERALEILRPVDPMVLGLEQRVLLHEMMGKCLFILGDADGADQQFFEVLKLNPTHEMDEVRTPRKILDRFAEVRGRRHKQLRRFPVEPARTIPGRDVPRVASNNMFIAFAPAGVFRLAFLGTPGKGMTLLTPQVLTLAASVASYAWVTWYANNQDDTCSNAAARNAFPTVKALNIITSVAAWLIYAVGIVDAFASQRYHRHAPGDRNKRVRVSSGWRWGPPQDAYLPD